VDQRIIDQGRGDCLRSCVASILELAPDQVPNFSDFCKYADVNWSIPMWNFLRERGMAFVTVYPPHLPHGYCVAVGPSPNIPGAFHAVVWKGSEIVHDPNPSRKGLAGEPTHYLVFTKVREEEVRG
jgi:hypothetical protein